jgi:hypothetical protein
MRFGNLLVLCQFGTLPADLTRKNMEIFAREVMPALKALAEAAFLQDRARCLRS